MQLVDLNYNLYVTGLLNCPICNKLSNNKLSDNNLASELVENGSSLNQSQSRKLWLTGK